MVIPFFSLCSNPKDRHEPVDDTGAYGVVGTSGMTAIEAVRGTQKPSGGDPNSQFGRKDHAIYTFPRAVGGRRKYGAWTDGSRSGEQIVSRVKTFEKS